MARVVLARVVKNGTTRRVDLANYSIGNVKLAELLGEVVRHQHGHSQATGSLLQSLEVPAGLIAQAGGVSRGGLR